MLHFQSYLVAALAVSAPAFARLQRLTVRQAATSPFVVEPLPDGKLDLNAKYSLRPATDLPNRTGQLNANQTHDPLIVSFIKAPEASSYVMYFTERPADGPSCGTWTTPDGYTRWYTCTKENAVTVGTHFGLYCNMAASPGTPASTLWCSFYNGDPSAKACLASSDSGRFVKIDGTGTEKCDKDNLKVEQVYQLTKV